MGSLALKTRQKNASSPTGPPTTAEGQDQVVAKPVVARALLEDIFERAQHHRHEGEAGPVEMLEQAEVGLVEVDHQPRGNGHRDAGDRR